MASFVASAITLNTTAGNKTVALTPAVNELLVVVFAHSSTSTAPVVTDDQGGTYTVVLNQTGNTRQVGIAVRDSLVSSAVLHTITIAESLNSGGGGAVLRISGMSKVGSAAVRSGQVVGSTVAAAGTPAITLPVAILTDNLVIAAIVNQTNPAGMTPPAGHTERHDVGFATPTTGFEVATADSGITATTVTWGSTTATAGDMFVAELDTSANAIVVTQPAASTTFSAVSSAGPSPSSSSRSDFSAVSGAGIAAFSIAQAQFSALSAAGVTGTSFAHVQFSALSQTGGQVVVIQPAGLSTFSSITFAGVAAQGVGSAQFSAVQTAGVRARFSVANANFSAVSSFTQSASSLGTSTFSAMSAAQISAFSVSTVAFSADSTVGIPLQEMERVMATFIPGEEGSITMLKPVATIKRV